MVLYDRIGIGYDTTRAADPYLLSRLIHFLHPTSGAWHLDVGCGTGNYTIALRSAGIKIAAFDFSRTMLSRLRAKCEPMPVVNARAEAIPFRAGAFKGATCTFVHHHMDDAVAAFAEVRRVLADGSRFVVLNNTADQLRHFWLCEYFPQTMASVIAQYEHINAAELLRRAGFEIETTENYDIREDLRDFFLYCGKLHPERYLDPKVRAGISTFANAPDSKEIEKGVLRLDADIKSRKIAGVMRKYAWDGGDYGFTIARR